MRSLCTLLLYAMFAATTMAAQFELPPLVEPASSEHHSGKVVWVELVTPDLATIVVTTVVMAVIARRRRFRIVHAGIETRRSQSLPSNTLTPDVRAAVPNDSDSASAK